MLIRSRPSQQPRLPLILGDIKRIPNPQHPTKPTRLRIRILPQPARIALILWQPEIPAIVRGRRGLKVLRDPQVEVLGFDPGEGVVYQGGVFVGVLCAGSVEFGVAEEEGLVQGEGAGDC